MNANLQPIGQEIYEWDSRDGKQRGVAMLEGQIPISWAVDMGTAIGFLQAMAESGLYSFVCSMMQLEIAPTRLDSMKQTVEALDVIAKAAIEAAQPIDQAQAVDAALRIVNGGEA